MDADLLYQHACIVVMHFLICNTFLFFFNNLPPYRSIYIYTYYLLGCSLHRGHYGAGLHELLVHMNVVSAAATISMLN